MFSKSVESAQKKVEGNNYDNRKSLLDYDNIVSEQRKIIYEKRNRILDIEDMNEIIGNTFANYVDAYIEQYALPEEILSEEDIERVIEHFNNNIIRKNQLSLKDLSGRKSAQIADIITENINKEFGSRVDSIPTDVIADFAKYIYLKVTDDAWINHISAMEHLREGIGLRGYGQSNPLQAYALEGYEIFDKMLDNIEANIAEFLLKVEIKQQLAPKKEAPISTNDGKEALKSKPIVKDKKVGRNDACPCGSGKKYKQCCGK